MVQPLSETVCDILSAVRDERPLVHCVSNLVTLTPVANTLLAIGASPIMAHSEEEVGDIVRQARALVLNIGTLSPARAAALRKAGEAAREAGVPMVLDPVGVGATALRRRAAADLLALGPAIVRGNAAEILSISGHSGTARGVDSMDEVAAALSAARSLSDHLNLVVAMTGESDFVTDGEYAVGLQNGDLMMSRVTGMGCAASALTGACLAVSDNRYHAAVAGLAIIAIAGELAATKAQGPGSFQSALFDCLYNLTGDEIKAKLRI